MKRYWLVGLVIVLVVGLAALLYFPETHYRMIGWLRREAFFQGRPTSFWILALKHDPSVEGLVPSRDVGKYLREGGAEAIPVLNEMLSSQDVEVQSVALVALNQMGPETKGALPGIKHLLTGETNTQCISLAKRLLLKLAPEETVAAFCQGFRQNPNWEIRRRCIAILETLDLPLADAAEPLRQALKDENGHVRLRAAKTLWKLTRDTDTVLPVVTCEVRSPDKPLASQALAEFTSIVRGKAAIPLLLEVLEDQDTGLRQAALGELAYLCGKYRPVSISETDAGPPTPQDIAETFDLLRKRRQQLMPVLLSALRSLGGTVNPAEQIILGIADADTVPALLDLLQDESIQTRLSAMSVLGKLKSKQAVSPLVECLKENLPRVEVKKGDPGISTLNEPGQICARAISAMGEIGPGAAPAVPVLIEAFKNGNFDTAVVVTLGEIGPRGNAAVPVLREALAREQSPYLGYCAAISLWQIDPNNSWTVPFLIRAADRSGSPIRIEAICKLGRIRPSYPVVKVLCDVIRANAARTDNPGRNERVSAIWALKYFGPEIKEAVPVLVESLKRNVVRIQDYGEVQAAIDVLAKIGTQAKEAIPVLQDVAAKADSSLQDSIKIALHKIDPKQFNRLTGFGSSRPGPSTREHGDIAFGPQ
jgi:HEAT repeat protein